MKAALHSASRRPRPSLETINPDAGTHPICLETIELQAALRAGERSWRRFPYYEQRFAARGQRFTRSDSAWLVSLADHGAGVVEQQVHWLARVLASRGMPRWLLELHLEVLYAELIAALPGKAASYASLRAAGESLREQRLRHVDEAALHAASVAFARQVGDDWDRQLPETGALLVAAVADETAGIPTAVASITGWMTDPSRFPPRWIDAVTATISAARRQARAA